MIEHCISPNFDEPFPVDKTSHLHNRVNRSDLTKEFAMHRGHTFPIFDACQQNSWRHRRAWMAWVVGVPSEIKGGLCVKVQAGTDHGSVASPKYSSYVFPSLEVTSI